MRNLLLGAFAVIGLVGCASSKDIRAHIETNDKKPSIEQYRDDKISIVQWRRIESAADQISIEISPAGEIKALQYRVLRNNDGSAPSVVATILDHLQIDPEKAREIRHRLSVYRPVEFDHKGRFLLPKDCSWVFDGGSALVNVTFEDRQGRSGSFVLQPECQNEHSRVIASDLKQIVRMLPTLKGTSGYGWLQ